MEKRELPVGVFDSGVGGISVLREMVRLLPREHFLFYGDSANAPYGTKSQEEVCRLTLERAAYLYGKGIKALVIACNTATSAAIIPLRQQYTDIPVIGIEPALKPATMVKENPTVLVMATPMTVEGNKFHELMHRFEERAEVIPLACPGLMEYVEAGKLDGEEVTGCLVNLLRPYMARRMDAVVLGCTHYPFVKPQIKAILGEEIPVLDGSEGTARELRRRLMAEGLERKGDGTGRVYFEMSLPEKIPLAKALLVRDGKS